MKTVRQEIDIDAIVDFAAERWKRGQDAWDALVWAIARDPERGSPVTPSGRTRMMVLEGASSIGLPTVTAIYICGPHQIESVDAHFC
jgi:hypothetical protein